MKKSTFSIPVRPDSVPSSSSSGAEVPIMLQFRRSNIWQSVPSAHTHFVLTEVNRKLKHKFKADILMKPSSIIAESHNDHYQHHRHKKKGKNRKGGQKQNPVITGFQEKMVENHEVVTSAKHSRMASKRNYATVRAESAMPYMTLPQSLTPDIPFNDKNQLRLFGKVLPEDKKYQGDEALVQYKSLIRSFYKWGHRERPSTPRRRYIEACEGYGVLPEALGVVRPEGTTSVLNLGNYGIGPKLQEAFATALGERVHSISDMRLFCNRLDDQRGASILSQIPHDILVLDISQNTLGPRSAEALAFRFLGSACMQLRVLDLSRNALGTNGAVFLCDGLVDSTNCRLQRLNLSHNNINSDAGKSLSKLIAAENISLFELNLSWNRIHGVGLGCFLRALQKNDKLISLDMSFNGLGALSRQRSGAPAHPMTGKMPKKPPKTKKKQKKSAGKKKSSGKGGKPPAKAKNIQPYGIITDTKAFWEETEETIQNIAFVLSRNRTLKLLDISHNNFDVQAMQLFRKSLINNHVLLELRIFGSPATIDAKGFIHVDDSISVDVLAPHLPLPADAHRWADRAWPTEIQDQRYPDGWISGGWREVKFIFSKASLYDSTGDDIWDDIEEVYLRLSIDNYMPTRMTKVWNESTAKIKTKKNISDHQFEAYRILQPGDTFFFFTVNDDCDAFVEKIPLLSSGYHVWHHESNVLGAVGQLNCGHQIHEKVARALDSSSAELACPKCQQAFNIQSLVFTDSVTVDTTNVVHVKRRDGPLICVHQQPRVVEYVEPRLKEKWAVWKSLFASRNAENSQYSLLNGSKIYDNCCHCDFRAFRLNKMIPDPQERKKVLDLFQSYYFEITDLFTHLAAKCVSDAKRILIDGAELNENVMKKDTYVVDATVDAPDCCICLNEAVNIAVLDGCWHKFCLSCITDWSITNRNCPQCKSRFEKIAPAKLVCNTKVSEVKIIRQVRETMEKMKLRGHTFHTTRAIFQNLDIHKSGFLSDEEMLEGLRRIDTGLNGYQLIALMEYMDFKENRSSFEISYHEFTRAVYGQRNFKYGRKLHLTKKVIQFTTQTLSTKAPNAATIMRNTAKSAFVSEDPFTIPLHAFVEWSKVFGLVNDIFLADEVHAMWSIAVAHGEASRVEENLSRRHFVAMLIRIAIRKYFELGKESSAPDAIKYFLLRVLLKDYSPKIEGDSFRETKLYRADCELVFLENIVVVQDLFGVCCTKITNNMCRHKFVSFEAAISFTNKIGLFNDNEVDERIRMEDISLAFVSSLLVVDDETRYAKHVDHRMLSYVAFLEFIGRLAELPKLDLRSKKERVVIKGKREVTKVKRNELYEIDFVSKLKRFIAFYLVEGKSLWHGTGKPYARSQTKFTQDLLFVRRANRRARLLAGFEIAREKQELEAMEKEDRNIAIEEEPNTLLATLQPKNKSKVKKKQPTKPPKVMPKGKVSDFIACIFEKKIKADMVDDKKNNTRDSLPEFLEDFFQQMFGMRKLANAKMAEFKAGIMSYSTENCRARWFGTLSNWLEDGAHAGATTPYADEAIHVYLFILGRVFPVDSIEELMDDEPCYFSAKLCIDAVKEVFSANLSEKSVSALLQHLNATSVVVKGKNCLEFDDTFDEIMKVWYRFPNRHEITAPRGSD